MSEASETQAAVAQAPSSSAGGRGSRRWPVVILVVVSLAVATLLQQWGWGYRTAAINRIHPPGMAPATNVGRLDSFSLALLLGGLRGPLVMYLWSSSESQKTERDLDSFDSKVEMIRLLQPEFDSVHLFQIWNKAYNVSVQMASLSNKYATILDGLDYGYRADEGNPNSINIISSIGQTLMDKLGNSAEKEYYRRRVRTETMPVFVVRFPAARRAVVLKALSEAGVDTEKVRISDQGATQQCVLDKFVGDRFAARVGTRFAEITMTAVTRQSIRPRTAGRRTEFDTLVTAEGMILPELLKPVRPLAAGQEGNNGSKLQYLAPFEPFRYGVSPIALGYNELKKAQILQSVGKQRHLQWSDLVVDNQPGMSLKMWSEEEADRGRKCEVRAFEPSEEMDRLPRELKTAGVTPRAKVIDRFALEEAIYSYRRTGEVADASLVEFARHLRNFSRTLQNYQSQTDSLKAMKMLTEADALYLEAVLAADDAQRSERLARARQQYELAEAWFQRILFRYYTMPEDARAIELNRAKLDQLTLAELRAFNGKLQERFKTQYGHVDNIPFATDQIEYRENLGRIETRLKLIGQ